MITKEVNGETHYLAQWNDKWKAFFLVGGHRENGESYRECVVREVCEELDIQEDNFQVSPEAREQLEYCAISNRTKLLTNYRHHLFDVSLDTHLAEGSNNAWLSAEEVFRSETNDGRMISDTMQLLVVKSY